MSVPVYIGYYFSIQPLQPASEILVAELGQMGFESFVETDKGLEAFIQKEIWNPTILDGIYVLNSDEFEISYNKEEIEPKNWNEQWEKNFRPIIVDEVCSVRAPFHKKPNTKFDIVIEPKMSFGTGHHETTHMMIQHILLNDFKNKRVLDMGCGTGILAILSEMTGAQSIDAVDIDNWCYLNTIENIERNHCKKIVAYEGDASILKNKSYDIVIANINRNILVCDIELYTDTLSKNGMLFLSGFYENDFEIINQVCEQNNLEFVNKIERNNWIAVYYKLK